MPDQGKPFRKIVEAMERGRVNNRPENEKIRPVAWRVHDYADGWILYGNEEAAKLESESSGALMQGLYVRDGTSPAHTEIERELGDWRQAAEVEVGIRREFQIECERLRDALERVDRIAISHRRGAIGKAQAIVREALKVNVPEREISTKKPG